MRLFERLEMSFSKRNDRIWLLSEDHREGAKITKSSRLKFVKIVAHHVAGSGYHSNRRLKDKEDRVAHIRAEELAASKLHTQQEPALLRCVRLNIAPLYTRDEGSWNAGIMQSPVVTRGIIKP